MSEDLAAFLGDPSAPGKATLIIKGDKIRVASSQRRLK